MGKSKRGKKKKKKKKKRGKTFDVLIDTLKAAAEHETKRKRRSPIPIENRIEMEGGGARAGRGAGLKRRASLVWVQGCDKLCGFFLFIFFVKEAGCGGQACYV